MNGLNSNQNHIENVFLKELKVFDDNFLLEFFIWKLWARIEIEALKSILIDFAWFQLFIFADHVQKGNIVINKSFWRLKSLINFEVTEICKFSEHLFCNIVGFIELVET